MSDARGRAVRHRHGEDRASRGGRMLSRMGGAALVAVLLVLIVALQDTLPDTDRKYRPLATKGDVEEVVRTPDFRIEVDKVEVATGITQPADAPGNNDKATPHSVWVIVWARATGEREPVYFDATQGVELVTGTGHRYSATSLGGLVQARLQPGLWKYGPIVFEIPPDRLAGAELRITTENRPSLNSEAHIFLGLDVADARRLVDNAPKTYVLEEVRYV